MAEETEEKITRADLEWAFSELAEENERLVTENDGLRIAHRDLRAQLKFLQGESGPTLAEKRKIEVQRNEERARESESST